MHKSPQHEEVLQALSNYCAARQLCDDIHDWKEDLLNGRLTYVHACLFFEAGIKEGTLPLDKLIQTLETQFFRTTLAFLLEEVEQLAANACEVLESTILVPNSTFTEAFIAPLIRTAKEGLAQHTRNRLLLRAIKKAL